MAGDDRSKYGRFYFCVQMESGEEVRFHADVLLVEPCGALAGYADRDDGRRLMFAAGAGAWKAAFAASVLDGGPVAVEHWDHPDT